MAKHTHSSDAVTIVQKFGRTAEGSKQAQDQSLKGQVNPPVSFYALQKAYEDSFILGGIFDKLAAAGNSGFQDTGNPELQKILGDLDMKSVFESLLVYGNVFIEKILGGNGKVVELSQILTHTMWCWNLDDEFAYVQRVSGKAVFFLPEEIIHSKISSILTKFYGESKFSKAIDQIVLLSQIDQYYGALFDNGLVGSSLFVDKGDSNGKKLSKENREALGDWLRDNATGVRGAYTTAIVPTQLEKLDLDKNIDTEAFLKYRSELIESIAIALNIPVDLLTPKSSNRSTSEIAYEQLNQIIVKPMQESFLKDLREALRTTFGNAVDLIEMNPIDSEDDEKEMKVLTGYKRAGIMTANEVREKLGLPSRDDGNVLVVDSAANNANGDQTAQDVAKEVLEIQKSLESMYGNTH